VDFEHSTAIITVGAGYDEAATLAAVKDAGFGASVQ